MTRKGLTASELSNGPSAAAELTNLYYLFVASYLAETSPAAKSEEKRMFSQATSYGDF